MKKRRPPPIDFLLVIALQEEFDYIRQVLPLGSQARSVDSWTYYRASLSHISGRILTGAVCCVGTMGVEEADAATTALIKAIRPKLVISIGISGLISDELHIGDVVVATDVQDYLDRSKIHQPDPSNPLTFEDIDFAGQSVRTTESIWRFITEFKYRYKDDWEVWQQNSEARINQLELQSLNVLRDCKLIADRPQVHVGSCACGPVLVASRDFKQVLKQRNRNFLAVDMESYGVLRAIDRSEKHIETLVIRGISDFSDERKKELDGIDKGQLRRYATQNAASILVEALKKRSIPSKETRIAETGKPVRGNEEIAQINLLCSIEFLPHHYRERTQIPNLQSTDLRILFAPFAETGITGNQESFFADLVNMLSDGADDFLLQVDGPAGTGKTTFLSLLYWHLYEQWSLEAIPFLPVYINLHNSRTALKKAWAQEGDERLDEIIESNFLTVKRLFLAYPDQPIVFLFDGLDEHIPLKRTVTHNLRELMESSAHKKVIAIRDDKEPLIRSMTPKRTVRFRPVPVDSDRYSPFVEAFLRLRQERSPSFATWIYSQVRQLQLPEVDFFVLSLLSRRLATQKEREDHSLSGSVYLYCKTYLAKQEINQPIEGTINEVARLAFQQQVRREEVLDPIRWPLIELVEKHPLVQDYLVARHISNELLDLRNRAVTEVNNLSFAYPFRINRFSKEILTGNEHKEKATIAIIETILRSRKTNENAKAHACYLAGRLITSQAKVRARKALNSASVRDTTGRRGREKTKPQLLLDRSIRISLAYLGDYKAQSEYINILLSDPPADRFNRGFHLEYYGDVEYDPSQPLSSDDELKPCPRTFNQLFRRLQTTPSSNPIFFIELQTVCSLAQHRHAIGKLETETRSKLRALLSDLLSRKQIRNIKLARYVAMVNRDLGKEQFSPLRAFDQYYGIKFMPRKGWTSRKMNEFESIAAHTYGTYLIGLFFLPESYDVEGYSKRTILDMLLIHDLAEAIIGDYLPSEKSPDLQSKEKEVVTEISLLGTYDEYAPLSQVLKRYEAFEEKTSINGRIAYEIDKLENLTQILRYLSQGVNVPDNEEWLHSLRSEITTELGLEILDKISLVYVRSSDR